MLSCWEVHLRSAALGKKQTHAVDRFAKSSLVQRFSSLQTWRQVARGFQGSARFGPWIGFGFDEVFFALVINK